MSNKKKDRPKSIDLPKTTKTDYYNEHFKHFEDLWIDTEDATEARSKKTFSIFGCLFNFSFLPFYGLGIFVSYFSFVVIQIVIIFNYQTVEQTLFLIGNIILWIFILEYKTISQTYVSLHELCDYLDFLKENKCKISEIDILHFIKENDLQEMNISRPLSSRISDCFARVFKVIPPKESRLSQNKGFVVIKPSIFDGEKYLRTKTLSMIFLSGQYSKESHPISQFILRHELGHASKFCKNIKEKSFYYTLVRNFCFLIAFISFDSFFIRIFLVVFFGILYFQYSNNFISDIKDEIIADRFAIRHLPKNLVSKVEKLLDIKYKYKKLTYFDKIQVLFLKRSFEVKKEREFFPILHRDDLNFMQFFIIYYSNFISLILLPVAFYFGSPPSKIGLCVFLVCLMFLIYRTGRAYFFVDELSRKLKDLELLLNQNTEQKP